MPSHQQTELSESQARRAGALKSALGPLTDLLDDPCVVEVMLNADGVVWVERVGEGVVRTRITMSAADADRMLRLVASEVLVELNAQNPSLSAKLPPPWGARLQAAIPPIVDAPVFALRKPARIVFSLDDYVSRGILTAAQRDALEFAVLAHDNILIGGGTPCDLGEGTLGPVARFESGEVVAYQIRSRRRRRLFVFRTLDVDDAFAVAVPGVRPCVQLLMELGTAGRIRLVKSLFAYLVRTGRGPSALPDIFYVRVAAALGGRLPPHKILVSLLKQSTSADGGIIATPGASRAQLAPDGA